MREGDLGEEHCPENHRTTDWLRLKETTVAALSAFPEEKMLQSLERCSSPFIIFVASLLDCLQYAHVSLVVRSPERDMLLQMWPHQC